MYFKAVSKQRIYTLLNTKMFSYLQILSFQGNKFKKRNGKFLIPVSKTDYIGPTKIKITFRTTMDSIGDLRTNDHTCIASSIKRHNENNPPYIEFTYNMKNRCAINGVHEIHYDDLLYKESEGEDHLITSFKVENQEICVPSS